VLNVPSWKFSQVNHTGSDFIQCSGMLVETMSASQTDLSQAYKFCSQERCRVQQYEELEFHQPKSNEVSEIVALCRCARTAAQTWHRLRLM